MWPSSSARTPRRTSPLLQLQDASGLATVALDDDNGVAVGDAVTAVGNAEGGGDLLAALGSVTALDQTMTASSNGSTPETLDGLIQFSAAVVPGDSGGPVFDDEGEVIGMTTAASSGTVDTVAYAIDIEDALVDRASRSRPGVASDTVTIGYPAFLGISLGSDGSVAGVLEGTPAASSGLVAGDVITAVDGVAVDRRRRSLVRPARHLRARRHRDADLDRCRDRRLHLGPRHPHRRTGRLRE